MFHVRLSFIYNLQNYVAAHTPQSAQNPMMPTKIDTAGPGPVASPLNTARGCPLAFAYPRSVTTPLVPDDDLVEVAVAVVFTDAEDVVDVEVPFEMLQPKTELSQAYPDGQQPPQSQRESVGEQSVSHFPVPSDAR